LSCINLFVFKTKHVLAPGNISVIYFSDTNARFETKTRKS